MVDKYSFVDDMFEEDDKYSFVDDMFAEQQPSSLMNYASSLYDTAKTLPGAAYAGTRKGMAGVGKQFWDVAGSVSDTLGPMFEDPNAARLLDDPIWFQDGYHRFATGLKELGKIADRGRAGADARIEEQDRLYPTDPYTVEGAASIIPEGLINLAPQALGALLGGPIAGIATAAITQGAGKQQQMLDEGYSLPDSTIGGIGVGGVTGATERLIPAFDWMTKNPAVKSQLNNFLKKTFGGAFNEAAEEVIQGGAEDVMDASFRKELPDPGKMVDDAALRAYAGGLVGGVAGGVSSIGDTGYIQPNFEQEVMDRVAQDAQPIQSQQGPLALPPGQTFETVGDPYRPQTAVESQVQGQPLALPDGQGFEMVGKPYTAEVDPQARPAEIEPTEIDPYQDIAEETAPVIEDIDPPQIESQTESEVSVDVDSRESAQIIEEMKSKGYEVYNTTPRPQPDGRSLPVTKAARHPVSRIAVRPELFQMRENVSQTGTTPKRKIEGDYDESKFGELIVFRPKDPKSPQYQLEEGQDVITVDGHHRTDYVKNPETTDSFGNPILDVKVIELREEDGWTPKLAEAYGAEQNIALGNVEQYDIASFYRKQSKAHGTDWAETVAKRLGINKSRNGKTIGLNASDAVWHNLQKGQIDDGQALVIARELPNDPEQQREYLKLALDGTSAKNLENKIIGSRVIPPPTIDGIDAKVWRDAAGNVIAREKKKASGTKNAYKHTQFSEYLALEDQHIVTDAAKQKFAESDEQVKKLQKLKKGEQSGLPQQQLQEFNKKTETEYERLMAQKAKEETQTGFQFNNESGAVMFPGKEDIKAIWNRSVSFANKVAKTVKPDVSRKALEAEYGTSDRNTSAQEYLDSPVGKVLKGINLPRNVARKYKNVPGLSDWRVADTNLLKNKGHNAAIFEESIRGYYALADDKRAGVQKFLYAQLVADQQNKKLPETDAYLKSNWNFDDEQIAALSSYRITMSQVAPEMIRKSMLENPPQSVIDKNQFPEYVDRVSQMINEWKKNPYVPLERSGKFYLYVKDGYKNYDGEDQRYFERFETREELRDRLREMEKVGIKREQMLFGDVKKLAKDADISSLSPEARMLFENVDAAASLDGSKLKREMGTFKKHLIKRKVTPGFDRDLDTATSNYLLGLANYMAHKQYDTEFKRAVKQVPLDEPALIGIMNDQYKYQKAYNPEGKVSREARKGMSVFYLQRLGTSLVNTSQVFSTLQPLITDHTSFGRSYTQLIKSTQELIRFTANKKFSQTEKGKWLKRYYDEQNLGQSQYAWLQSAGKGEASLKKSEGVGKYFKTDKDWTNLHTGLDPLFHFKMSEDFTRGVAYLAGYDIGYEKGLRGEKLHDWVNEEFVNESMFDYSKANRPKIAQNSLGSMMMTFRLFPLNYYSFLKARKTPTAVLQSVGNLFLLGGLPAMVGVQEFLKMYRMMGGDETEDLREWLPEDVADTILFGAFGKATGINVSGNLSMDQLQGAEEGWEMAAAKLIGGVPIATLQQFGAAAELWQKGRHRQAVEKAAPAQVRALLRLERWNREGELKGTDNKPVLDRAPGVTENIATAMGLQPLELSKEYERRHRLYSLREKITINNENINDRLADTLAADSIDGGSRTDELLAEVDRLNETREIPITINKSSVRQAYRKHADHVAASLRAVPKKGREKAFEIDQQYSHTR